MPTQLTLSQVATQLHVSEKSIRRYIKSGRIKAKLIRGAKGDEYRIDKDQLRLFQKPARGKSSHKKNVVKKSVRIAPKPKKIIKQPDYDKQDNNGGFSSVEDVALEKIQRLVAIKEDRIAQERLIDYRLLYERLLAKYENSLIIIGGLESQLMHSRMEGSEKIKSMEEAISKQEELIMELYQTIQLYRKSEDIQI